MKYAQAIQILIDTVCKEFDITKQQLTGRCRQMNIVNARKAFSFLAKEFLNATQTQIALTLNVDQGTVSYLISATRDHLFVFDAIMTNKIESLKQKLYERLEINSTIRL